MKVLIVDDNKDNLYLLETMLHSEGYDVVPAINGVDALEKLRADKFDLIISDILMPQMDGFRLCRECKSDAGLASIPFVFYTATYVDDKDEELALSLGASRFIRKPIEPDAFMDIIRGVARNVEAKQLLPSEAKMDEEDLMVLYSQRLVKKLEKKIADLEEEIARRKEAEESLRVLEEKYRIITENVRDVIVMLDLDLNLKYISPSVEQISSTRADEILKMSLGELLTPDSLAKAMQVFEEQMHLARSGYSGPLTSRIMELEIMRQDGINIWVEANIGIFRDVNGSPAGIIAVFRDISERKRSQEELRQLEMRAHIASRLASVGELAAGVAHEINNPLTAVIGYAQLLLNREDVPDYCREELKLICQGAQRVSSIVRRLLTFSRQVKPEKRLVDINELVKSTLELRDYHLKVNNIEVTTNLDPALPRTVVDPGQIQQVLLNLIVNAETEMKSAHGGGHLTITTEKTDNIIKISVKDDGPGIKPEIINKIFEPFFTTKEVGQGTGLGLSLCYGIIAEHGGHIYVQSEYGRGANFIVELPVKEMQAAFSDDEEKSVSDLGKLDKARILVVDDEPIVREFLKRVLSGDGHDVDLAGDGMEAMQRIKSADYNLVLLDIKMPGIDGLKLFHYLKRDATVKSPQVIFITGDIMSPETQSILAQTKAPCIAKPFDIAQLRTEVKKCLAKDLRST